MKPAVFLIILSIGSILGLQAQMIPLRSGQLWGYCDTSKKIIISPQYNFAELFTDTMAFVKKDTLYYSINPEGKIIAGPFRNHGLFKNGVCPVRKMDGKYMYIYTSGKPAFDAAFDAAENFSEERAVISIDKKLGIINLVGQWIRVPDFDTSSGSFRDGYLLAVRKGKYFFINKGGKILQLPDTIIPGGIYSEGLAPVYVSKPYISNGKAGRAYFLEYIDHTGKIVLSGFNRAGVDYSEYIVSQKEFKDGKALIKTRNDLGWDYFFIDQKKQFSPVFASARHLGDSLFLGVPDNILSEDHIYNSSFKTVGFFVVKPMLLGEYSDGLIPFRDRYGFWGYADKNGRLVILARYSVAYNFSNGFALVLHNGQLGFIDRRGVEYFSD